jgi:hypothetical protein
MAYASIAGRARTSSRNPQAHAICDRCGGRFNLVDLHWQYDWRGAVIQNLRILVCKSCLDVPQEQQRAIVVPADPTPMMNARTEPFCIDETDFRSISQPIVLDPETGIPIPSTTLRVTEDCKNRTLTPFGKPVGLTQNAVMPFNGAKQKAYGVQLQLLSVTSNGTDTVSVTCSKMHGLHTDDQISAEGLADNNADGFYSVTVQTATAFTYALFGSISPNSLLTPTTRIITCLVGLPCDYDQIPQIDGTDLFLPPVCFLELESGSGIFLLEGGFGQLALETCMQAPFNPKGVIDNFGNPVTDSSGVQVTSS